MSARIHYAQLEWSSTGQPRSLDYGDVYFSAAGGLAESHHVFILGNRLPERWANLTAETFHIGELGFGSGLNFLQSWKLWEAIARPEARLHYVAFELHPLEPQALQRILSLWPALSPWSEKLQHMYPVPAAGLQRLHLTPTVTLDLYLGDARQGLREYQSAYGQAVDCWFLDGFSPSCNPEMWSLTTLRELLRHSRDGTTLSSYSVAGNLRRNLRALGFDVRRVAGFGIKRQMLCATLPAANRQRIDPAGNRPWFHLPRAASTGRQVAVIGAGMAGCAVASRLAQRGFRVTVFDKAASLAAGASGNPQAVLHCRLAANAGAVAGFYLNAFLYARQIYTALQLQQPIDWQPCGILFLDRSEQQLRPGKPAPDYQRYYPASFLEHCDQSAASARAGMELPGSGWWLPLGGWLDPVALCKAYLHGVDIDLRLQTEVSGLSREGNRWCLQTSSNTACTADVVVIANSLAAADFLQTRDLPLSSVRGQLTELRATPDSRSLQTIVAGAKTLVPAAEDKHCLMATYQRGQQDCNNRSADDEENLTGLSSMLPGLDVAEMSVSNSRAALRCASPDRLPVIGPVPNQELMAQTFAGLQRNAQARITAAPAYHPGLYVTTAHGSYGLTTCPLAAEYLAALISNECLPVTRKVSDALHPARFLIRHLKRQQQRRN